MNNQHQQARDGALQIQAAGSVVVNLGEVTREQAKEIAMQTFSENMLVLAGVARKTADGRARDFIDLLIDKLISGFGNLDGFKDPGVLSAVYDAQKSYAETGDRSLGDMLSDLLVKLATSEGEEQSSRKVIFRQALRCAPCISASQARALAVISIMQYRVPQVSTLDELVDQLDARLKPFYGKIPLNPVEYDHMGACGVGFQLLGEPAYRLIASKYPHIFYDSFSQDLVARELRGCDPNYYEWSEGHEGAGYRFTDAAIREFVVRGESVDLVNAISSWVGNPVRDLYQKQAWSPEKTKACIRELNPDLALILDRYDSSRAHNFQMTAAGMVIGFQVWKQAAPDMAPDIESLLD
ncbi:LPO_1073/Vpar_1526 family protein [Nocardia vaccinii]|uniref:LPO_1073/Vpar_1526 family protein n=1 Tax=Nocardia vaccinii TaxID=1822 RepID=UPI000A49C53A|nr:LPO_1073/Vpar_1526 family protein [Nocardia vaccinii]